MKKTIGVILIAIGAGLLFFGDKLADLTGLSELGSGSTASVVAGTVCLVLGFTRFRGR